jgi:anti-sigma-K factor RskA
MTKAPKKPVNSNPQGGDDMLAAEFVLGLLPQSERQAFARRLAAEPALAVSVRYWEEHFVQFTDEMEAPPPQVKAALDQRLFASGATPAPSLWNSLAFWRGLAAAALAAMVAVTLYTLQPAPQSQPLVARLAGEQTAPTLVALYETETGALRLNRTSGDAATGRSLELWLIAGNDAPVSLGVLPASSTSSITVPVALRQKFAGGVLALSDEPAGGSPTGAPTGAVLATGQLTAI